jgi:hypothetical protein
MQRRNNRKTKGLERKAVAKRYNVTQQPPTLGRERNGSEVKQ